MSATVDSYSSRTNSSYTRVLRRKRHLNEDAELVGSAHAYLRVILAGTAQLVAARLVTNASQIIGVVGIIDGPHVERFILAAPSAPPPSIPPPTEPPKSPEAAENSPTTQTFASAYPPVAPSLPLPPDIDLTQDVDLIVSSNSSNLAQLLSADGEELQLIWLVTPMAAVVVLIGLLVTWFHSRRRLRSRRVTKSAKNSDAFKSVCELSHCADVELAISSSDHLPTRGSGSSESDPDTKIAALDDVRSDDGLRVDDNSDDGLRVDDWPGGSAQRAARLRRARAARGARGVDANDAGSDTYTGDDLPDADDDSDDGLRVDDWPGPSRHELIEARGRELLRRAGEALRSEKLKRARAARRTSEAGANVAGVDAFPGEDLQEDEKVSESVYISSSDAASEPSMAAINEHADFGVHAATSRCNAVSADVDSDLRLRKLEERSVVEIELFKRRQERHNLALQLERDCLEARDAEFAARTQLKLALQERRCDDALVLQQQWLDRVDALDSLEDQNGWTIDGDKWGEARLRLVKARERLELARGTKGRVKILVVEAQWMEETQRACVARELLKRVRSERDMRGEEGDDCKLATLAESDCRQRHGQVSQRPVADCLDALESSRDRDIGGSTLAIDEITAGILRRSSSTSCSAIDVIPLEEGLSPDVANERVGRARALSCRSIPILSTPSPSRLTQSASMDMSNGRSLSLSPSSSAGTSAHRGWAKLRRNSSAAACSPLDPLTEALQLSSCSGAAPIRLPSFSRESTDGAGVVEERLSRIRSPRSSLASSPELAWQTFLAQKTWLEQELNSLDDKFGV